MGGNLFIDGKEFLLDDYKKFYRQYKNAILNGYKTIETKTCMGNKIIINVDRILVFILGDE